MKSRHSFLLVVFILFYASGLCQSWTNLTSGTNNTVYALATDSINDVLYVGGKYTTAGGSANNYLAKWDGTSWQSVGNAFNARIYFLVFLEGEIYAAGDFTTIDGSTFNHIAKWDGTDWISFGAGVDGTVYTAEIYNDTLFIGGSFLNSGGNPVSKIAKWDGANWVQVNGGMNLKVRALKSFGGELYVGGAFTLAGGNSISRIAKWDGISWSALGGGMDYDVYDIEIFNNQIHASGWFSPSPAKYIARWDGSAWQSLGTGTNARVPDMHVFNNELYITGAFTAAGGNSINRIAKWNGSTWSAVGSPGLEGSVTAEGYALEDLGGALFAAGDFNSAGGVSANNIAQWGAFCPRPAAAFMAVPDTGGVVAFNNTSLGGSSWIWDFGDGNNSNTYNPTHAYVNAGTYYVCLTVTDTCGSHAFCDSVSVELCQLPIANFSFIESGLTVVFTNTSFSGLYSWDFGDGNLDSASNPSHTYIANGTYNACLTATDSCGSDTYCDSIMVTCPVPVASFTYADSGLTVTFSNTSSDGSPFWDFNDGTTDTLLSPVHTFANSGAYNVCLTMTNICGSSAVCDSITIFLSGVQNSKAPTALSLFPNPGKDKVKIQVSTGSITLIQLYNSLGQKTGNFSYNDIQDIYFNLSPYDDGLYYLKVFLDSGIIVTRPLLIQR